MNDNTEANNGASASNLLFEELLAALPPVVDYTADNYPRQGCVVLLTVERAPFGITVRVYPPDAALDGAPIEVYGAKTPDAVAIALFDWLRGRAPRRGYQTFQLGESTATPAEDAVPASGREHSREERRKRIQTCLDALVRSLHLCEYEELRAVERVLTDEVWRSFIAVSPTPKPVEWYDPPTPPASDSSASGAPA